MKREFSKVSLGLAVAAMAVSPVQATDLPQRAAPLMQVDYAKPALVDDVADEANQYRRYRYHRRHRDRIDAGDVLTGALIIGGIFAIASAVDKNKRNDRYDNDYVSNDEFDRAVDRCVDRVERDQRIGSVDNVGRTSRGYSVSGTLCNGTNFSCQVSGNGRVTDVDYGYGGVRYQSGGDAYDGQQYSDDAYTRARQNSYSTPDSNAQPAYPGGPLPGEEQYEDGEPY